MNKSELVEQIAKTADIPKTTAAKALDAFIETVTTTLKEGNQVTIIGFGSFLVRDRKERTITNPKTKDKMQIPATKTPAFKAGKTLKDAVANKEQA